MTLVKRPFSETFTFARPIAADHRDETGAIVTAPAGAPRFDHDADGVPKGLLVEPGPAIGQHDALMTLGGWDAGVGQGMVLHEFEQDGAVRRAAYYATRVKPMADACLAAAVHHREIIAVDGYLRNRGGYVRYDGRNWSLGDAVAITPGPIAAPVLGDLGGRPLIEG